MKILLCLFLLIIQFNAYAVLHVNDNYESLDLWLVDRSTGESAEASFPAGLQSIPDTMSGNREQSVLLYRASDGLLVCHLSFYHGNLTKKVARGYCCIPFVPADQNVLQGIIVQPYPCN